MLLVVASITLVLFVVPLAAEALTKGWRRTIIADAIREYHQSSPREPATGQPDRNRYIGKMTQILTHWFQLLRNAVAIIFGGSIGGLAALFLFALIANLFSLNTAFCIAGTVGGFIAGLVSVETRGRSEDGYDVLAAALASAIFIIEHLWYSFGTISWWVLILQPILALFAGGYGAWAAMRSPTRI